MTPLRSVLQSAPASEKQVSDILSNVGPAGIWSLVLFGSRARGDHNSGSDTDLLLITSEPRPRHGLVSNISLSFYPADYLTTKAQAGDLFVCHLVNEAKVLSDSNGVFDMVRRAFRLRKSYGDEIAKATELGWFLFHHGAEFEQIRIANRRIAWCVRTILIARTAEARQPIFSADALEKFSRSRLVGKLIRHKASDAIDDVTFRDLRAFLTEWGSAEISPAAKSPNEYLDSFRETTNTVGMHTFKNGWATASHIYM
jgi:predicted nucleotidyltransferase